MSNTPPNQLQMDLGGLEKTSQQSYAEQLAWCQQTRNALYTLTENMHRIGQGYVSVLAQLLEAGYMNENFQQMVPLVTQFKDQLYAVMRVIESDHIGYINDQARNVEESIAAAKESV